jgi:hypothetical protein
VGGIPSLGAEKLATQGAMEDLGRKQHRGREGAVQHWEGSGATPR